MQPVVRLMEKVVVGAVAITARATGAVDPDLTFGQWRVLFVIGERAEGMTVGDIALRTGANASPASRLIGRLRRRGLLRTAKDVRDGRVTRVRLTESGLVLRRRVLAARSGHLRRVLADASLAPGEAAVVAKLARSFEPFE